MYHPGADSDVPAPFDEEEEEDDGVAAILEEERGDASGKASKRSLVVLDEGELFYGHKSGSQAFFLQKKR